MAFSSLYADSTPHDRACSAMAESIWSSATLSWMRSVRSTIAVHTRWLIRPSMNKSATRGSRYRSERPRCMSPEARPRLTPRAAPTSAAVASHGSQAQYALSSSPHRRRTNSAMDAIRWAAALASARARCSIAVTMAASLADLSPPSNMCSSIPTPTDRVDSSEMRAKG